MSGFLSLSPSVCVCVCVCVKQLFCGHNAAVDDTELVAAASVVIFSALDVSR